MNLVANDVKSYLKCANGIIIKNYYSKYGTLDNRSRNSLATLVITAEFNLCIDKPKFVIRTARFDELTSQIISEFPKEPAFVYFIPYNSKTRSVAKGKLWESYNYLKKKLQNFDNPIKTEENNSESVDAQIKFLLTHFEPMEDVMLAWKETFHARQKLLESPTSTTSIEQYFSKFPILKGPFGGDFILTDFELKYKGFENKLAENWDKINKIIIEIADSKNSPEIQLMKQQKCNDILMLCLLPFLLPHAYLKKNNNSKRTKLTKQEILENIFIHIKVSNIYISNDLLNYNYF